MTNAAVVCAVCRSRPPQIRRPATTEPYCKDCFLEAFEKEVHRTIVTQKLFEPGDRVAVAVSGGKDSTVLAHLMAQLNARYHYGLDLFLLAVDEGITGYRDDSLEMVYLNEKQLGIPLTVVSYEELYGWRMDQIVATVGKKNNCTFCGVFRRQALDRGAQLRNATKICTGHNADDAAETALMNILRGDVGRFERCSEAVTGRNEKSALPRCKPLMFTYEKEIVLYAHFKKLPYFSTECIYSPNAYRGHAREFIKLLEVCDSQLIATLLHSVTQLQYTDSTGSLPKPGRCEHCNWMSSNKLCKACVLLEALNQKNPHIALVNKSRRERLLQRKPRLPRQEVALDDSSQHATPPETDSRNCHSTRCCSGKCG